MKKIKIDYKKEYKAGKAYDKKIVREIKKEITRHNNAMRNLLSWLTPMRTRKKK